MLKFRILSLIFLLFISTLFVGCDNTVIKFNGFSYIEDYYTITVENDINEFSLIDTITVKQGYSWSVSKDQYGITTFTTKKVPLTNGDNNYYIIVFDNNGDSKLYKINIHKKSFNIEPKIVLDNEISYYEFRLNDILGVDFSPLPGDFIQNIPFETIGSFERVSFKVFVKCTNYPEIDSLVSLTLTDTQTGLNYNPNSFNIQSSKFEATLNFSGELDNSTLDSDWKIVLLVNYQ